jgi:predicted GNAT superfamily acetyltransferase
MPDLINAGDDSDRLMAKWVVGPTSPSEKSLTTTIPDSAITISVPEDIVKLRETNLAEAKSARVRVREEFLAAFKDGYKVMGFSDQAGYVLTKGAK